MELSQGYTVDFGSNHSLHHHYQRQNLRLAPLHTQDLVAKGPSIQVVQCCHHHWPPTTLFSGLWRLAFSTSVLGNAHFLKKSSHDVGPCVVVTFDVANLTPVRLVK